MGPLFSRNDVEIIMQCFQSESLKSIYNTTHTGRAEATCCKSVQIQGNIHLYHSMGQYSSESEGIHLSPEHILGSNIDEISLQQSNKAKEKKAPLHTNCYYCADYEIKFTVLSIL